MNSILTHNNQAKTPHLFEGGQGGSNRYKVKNSPFLQILAVCIIIITLFTACTPNNNGENPTASTPQKVTIPRDSMVNILIDIHLAEAMIQQVRRNRDSTSKANIRQYYQTIFEQHNVQEQAFKDAFLYYSKNIEEFNKMYEEIQIRLSKMEAEAKAD